VSVTAVRPDHQLTVILEDDGVGFDVVEAQRGGLGLLAMRERAEAMGRPQIQPAIFGAHFERSLDQRLEI
jgi:nitrate/nitrite-specific signal transduction histidine kinase